MRHWTPQERERQSRLIHAWKPWRHAGVKTPEGKAKSRMNAWKHGGRSAEIRALSRALVAQARVLRKLI
jgi:hypothetical protein